MGDEKFLRYFSRRTPWNILYANTGVGFWVGYLMSFSVSFTTSILKGYHMIHPDKVKEEAKKKEKENFKFRSYLKGHADEVELDRQFFRLHKELFADYDCSKCRNCCKMYQGSIPQEDVEQDAEYLGITPEQFVDVFLVKEEYGIGYHTKHIPCDFLQEDGNCKLGNCKPDSCKKYPYTDQSERLWSLLGILDSVGVCPVVFEIFERLKKEYNFRRR